MTIILFIFWFLLTYFTYDILIYIKIDMEIAKRTAKMMMLSNFSLPLQVLNQIFQTYLSCQKITIPFFYSNIISFIIALFFGRKFIIIDNYREIGFCYTRIVQELFNLTFSLAVMVLMANRKSLIFPNKKLVFENFWTYAILCIKTSIAFYGENLSFELNSYLAARFGNIQEFTVFVICSNLILPIYYMCIGIANTFRTNLGNIFGEENIQKAKSTSQVYILYVIILTLIINGCFELFCEKIAFIYCGGNEKNIPDVMKGFRIYYLDTLPTLLLYSLNSILRFLNKQNLVNNVTVIIFPILVFLNSIILAFGFDMRIWGLFWSFPVTQTLILVFFLYKISTIDWEKGYEQFKKKTNLSIN